MSLIRLCLVHVKYFPENKYFSQMLFSGKENVFRLFGCLGIHFTENQFRCLVRSNILRKMHSVLRKINSHVWFGQTFYEKWNLFFYGKSIPMFGLWIILRKIWNALQIQAPALPRQTCNNTKLIINFNIKNNHPNSSTCIA